MTFSDILLDLLLDLRIVILEIFLLGVGCDELFRFLYRHLHWIK